MAWQWPMAMHSPAESLSVKVNLPGQVAQSPGTRLHPARYSLAAGIQHLGTSVAA